jgi:hypothetical protein
MKKRGARFFFYYGLRAAQGPKHMPSTRVLFLALECLSQQVRVVPSINTPTRVNPSLFCS